MIVFAGHFYLWGKTMGKSKKNHEGSIYIRKNSPYYWIEYQGKCFSSKVRIGETKGKRQSNPQYANIMAERQISPETFGAAGSA